MSRDEIHIRDRLLLLAECSNPHKPFNVKRKSLLSKSQSSAKSTSGFSRKLSVQDFVRMDPGYTPDIEHLVFRKRNPQQVAPINPPQVQPTKTRSRLAEMFALSRHLQQRSVDREAKRGATVNRSIDSILEPSAVAAGLRSTETVRRWVSSAEETVRQNSIGTGGTRLSPVADKDMTTVRGSNVSVLHLRNTSEPWEKSPSTGYSQNTASSSSVRSYISNRSTTSSNQPPPLKKHQSLGSATTSSQYKWSTSPNFHRSSGTNETNRSDMFITSTKPTTTTPPSTTTATTNCNRELSPVRWCDREVDGVYLGRSGWVQVQQRSLDDNRRSSYKTTTSSLQSRRTGIKLADYHCNSEPASKSAENKLNDLQQSRPAYLSLQTRDFERKLRTPSPRNVPETDSPPPSLTPIISPPPAFQDKDKNKTVLPKSRTFFGKTPFLPRSNAIEDSDASPPQSPIVSKWKTVAPLAPQIRKPITINESSQNKSKIPQTKSMEDTTAVRRSQFLQRYGESSSSSSSASMNFRSLDSSFTRPTMPRLSENTDSSVDVYEDADDEDNNSSSINISMINTLTDYNNRQREKISPSSRANRLRTQQQRRSPAGSDTNKPPNSPASSTSSDEFISRSPPPPPPSQQQQQQQQQQQTQLRKSAPIRQQQQYPFNKSPQQEDQIQKVRRSRSLQLPERKQPSSAAASVYRPSEQNRISPQQYPDRMKVVNQVERNKRHSKPQSLEGDVILDDDMLREAEVVTGFLYGNRSRAAAQALHMHNRYNNNNMEEKTTMMMAPKPNTNGLTVYYVGNPNKERQRLLLRGSTSPSLSGKEIKNPCNSDTCDFWPHCAHRESLNRDFMMRSSQSYPTHQRSLDDPRSTKMQRRIESSIIRKSNNSMSSERRPSPTSRQCSPVNPASVAAASSSTKLVNRVNNSGSSSGSDAWMTPNSKSPKNTLRSSGQSTPIDEISIIMDDKPNREMILTRPGSAPTEDRNVTSTDLLVSQQQRSMSLPKSFLSASYQGGSRRRGTESLGSSPGFPRKIPTPETSHTAPVTPLHEGNRRRSPLGGGTRRAKATSTPQLLDTPPTENRKWGKTTVDASNEFSLNPTGGKDYQTRRNLPAESVLQKFRKTFSLRFQKKGSKEGCISGDVGETLSEILGEPSEEESPQHVPSISSSNCQIDVKDSEQSEQKYRFGPLIWRSSKERKKLNKAARSAKCNSGDSGIQIEMVPGSVGAGDSSESHDIDPHCDELDSPPTVRKRPPPQTKSNRPHSDLLNQILIDKFKADLKQHSHKHQQVRRTRSDLGGQRLLHWDPRSSYRRLMSSPAPLRGRPQSPRKKPPDIPVQLRQHQRRGHLRRSLSQPLDIDKLSPLMRIKAPGLKASGSNVLSEDETRTSDDDMMSDSESSIASLTERKKSLELAMDEEMVILAEAVFDHVAIDADELGFRAGDVIEVLETNNREWWWGSTTNGKTGWFPAQFVRLRVSQEDTVEDCLAAMASGQSMNSSQIRRRTSISLLSNDQVRTSVVRELVHTERDFVKVLQDVAEGYISECRKRTDMFTPEQIQTIFINLEDILKFQSGFLKDLEQCIDWDVPHKSCVGSCFLKHRTGFKMYSDYCNSHPMATATLQELYEYNNYSKFFEACRLMRGLIEIPLDGYLLTPVQRICKYPLQLAELLKYTKQDHKDYNDIKQALEVMRNVAVLINERKRRMESLEKLAAWQQRVEGWEDSDLIEVSSQLIHQGEVVRVTTGMWTNNITLFLFDHQVIYCKKDILKRNTYVYKGRICLDTCEIIDVPDGKDIHLGVSVRHAIKLYSCVRDKWLLFCCRSSNDKQRWLRMFAEERRLVEQDKNDGLELPATARKLARLAARCQKRPPRKPRNGKNYKHDSGYMGSSLQLNTNSNSLGRKMGTWFTFGANKKSRHHHQDVS